MKHKNTPITGTFTGTGKGFGFVTPDASERKGADDIFIPPHFVLGALHGDIVEVRPVIDTRAATPAETRGHRNKNTRGKNPRGKTPPAEEPQTEQRQLGRITQIVKRGAYVGTFYTEGAQGYVRSVEPKIPYSFAVPPKSRNRFLLADGHRVLFSVDKNSRPEDGMVAAFVTEVLGHMHDPGVDVMTLVRQAGIPYEWPQEVTDAAARVPTELTDEVMQQNSITQHRVIPRRDLRHWQICTIDGDDTKDIDDAISLEMTADGHYKLGVHIADVTHYVPAASPIDREALNRGTSVYLADRVIPMLPHALSSGICSLFADVDRLALSCVMTIDDTGNVLEYEIFESIIRSCKRWTYNEVEALLATAVDLNATTNWWQIATGWNMLREILWNKRRARGALDFDLPEAKIRVDESGRPISIEPHSRNRATAIIEEFMIVCNETIATHCMTQKLPAVFRTHEPPNAMKLAQLTRTAINYGIKIPKLAVKPKALQKVLDKIADTPAAYAVSGAVLRALPQALYTPDNPTHYGLASEAYAHFTSPIRRYADLQLHRIIKASLIIDATERKAALKAAKADLASICAQASRTEREAEALEREVAQLKKVQFMQGYEGEMFDGIVSGITAWGVYVMLPSTVEGMIPIESIKKTGLRYDKERKCFVSKRNREALMPGTELTVRLISADEEERKITFGF
ncbi:MAG: ribonuclease R [Defluviitaleaceae bacterium]|nr:ribonuclease R [Defluviitaleaceae bacterium]